MSVGVATILWQGFTGSPGYTTLCFGPGAPDPVDGQGMIDATDAFAVDISALLATGHSVTVLPEINWFNTTTGVLEDVTAVSPAPTAHVGSSGQSGPIAAGMVISWTTAGINRGRKVRGRNFIVPVNKDAFESNGSPSATAIGLLTGAAADLAGSTDATFGIWSRPRLGAGGAWFPVTTWRVPDFGAVLRSRRD